MSVEREENHEVYLTVGEFRATVRGNGCVFLYDGGHQPPLYFSSKNKDHTVELLKAVIEELER